MTAQIDGGAFTAADSVPIEGRKQATHVWTPNGMQPIETWQAEQRARLERHEPPPAPPTPRPDRAGLDAVLVKARTHKALTAKKLTKAEATLAQAEAVADAARAALAEIEDQEAAANAGSVSKIKTWIATGALGAVPRALNQHLVQRKQVAEADLSAATGAVVSLQYEYDEAKQVADAALADLHVAARAVLAEDAADLAERLEALETEAAALWHRLWAHSFASPAGKPIRLDPSTAALLNTPPIKADRAGTPLARRTVEGLKAIEAVRAKFAALVAGAPVSDPGSRP